MTEDSGTFKTLQVDSCLICRFVIRKIIVASWDENQRTLEITGVAGSVFYGTTRNRCGMFESA
jgi:hypothetical protein